MKILIETCKWEMPFAHHEPGMVELNFGLLRILFLDKTFDVELRQPMSKQDLKASKEWASVFLNNIDVMGKQPETLYFPTTEDGLIDIPKVLKPQSKSKKKAKRSKK
jgi:hypothetical protein